MIRAPVRFNHKHILFGRNNHIGTEAHIVVSIPIGGFGAYSLGSWCTAEILVRVGSPWILFGCNCSQTRDGGNTWHAILVSRDNLSVVKGHLNHGECSQGAIILHDFICGMVGSINQLEDDTMAAVLTWIFRHDTMPGFDAIREEETITRVHRGGVEGITTIGSAACCARSRFAVVDAEVIIQPTFHRYRGSVGHSGG